MILLAEGILDTPWIITLVVLVGLIGIAGAMLIILQLCIAAKKLWGKQPPMHEQISDLRDEFMREIASHQASVKTWMNDHEHDDAAEFSAVRAQITGVDKDVKDFRGEVQRNGDTRKRDIEGKVEDARKELKDDIGEVRKELGEKIDDKHKDVQTQLNEIHSALGEVSGELKAMNK